MYYSPSHLIKGHTPFELHQQLHVLLTDIFTSVPINFPLPTFKLFSSLRPRCDQGPLGEQREFGSCTTQLKVLFL